MKKIPSSINAHLSRAQERLDEANRHPSPTSDLKCIALLLEGWKSIAIAEEEVDAWVEQMPVSSSVYEDVHLFRTAPAISQRSTVDGKIQESTYSTGHDLLLLQTSVQDPSSAKDESVHERGWDLDAFRNELGNKIKWTTMLIEQYKKLD